MKNPLKNRCLPLGFLADSDTLVGWRLLTRHLFNCNLVCRAEGALVSFFVVNSAERVPMLLVLAAPAAHQR